MSVQCNNKSEVRKNAGDQGVINFIMKWLWIYENRFFFFRRGHGNESCNLIGGS